MDVTGHNVSPMTPKWIMVPAPNGSFLLRFKWTVRCAGETCESTAMSLDMSTSEENASSEGQVNSPARMNAKNPSPQHGLVKLQWFL